MPLSVTAESDKGVTHFSSAVKPGTPVVPLGNERIRRIYKHVLTRPCRSQAPGQVHGRTKSHTYALNLLFMAHKTHLASKTPQHSVCPYPTDTIRHTFILRPLPEPTAEGLETHSTAQIVPSVLPARASQLLVPQAFPGSGGYAALPSSQLLPP